MDPRCLPSPAAGLEGQLPLWRGADRWVRRWRVPSETEPGLTYVVAVDAEGRFGCSCPAWVHDPERRPCKHLRGFAAGGGPPCNRLPPSAEEVAVPSSALRSHAQG